MFMARPECCIFLGHDRGTGEASEVTVARPGDSGEAVARPGDSGEAGS